MYTWRLTVFLNALVYTLSYQYQWCWSFSYRHTNNLTEMKRSHHLLGEKISLSYQSSLLYNICFCKSAAEFLLLNEMIRLGVFFLCRMGWCSVHSDCLDLWKDSCFFSFNAWRAKAGTFSFDLGNDDAAITTVISPPLVPLGFLQTLKLAWQYAELPNSNIKNVTSQRKRKEKKIILWWLNWGVCFISSNVCCIVTDLNWPNVLISSLDWYLREV